MRRSPALCSLHAFEHSTTYGVLDKHLIALCFRKLLLWYPRFDQQRTPLFLASYSHVSSSANRSSCLLWAIRGCSIDPEAYCSFIETHSVIARIYY